MINKIIEDIYSKNYKTIFIGTTAKESLELIRLPDKILSEERAFNLLITRKELLYELFEKIDGKIQSVFIDVEMKKNINLMSIANCKLNFTNVIPYKPNDITMESADILLSYHFQKNIESKKILIYGTGNIAFKLALRLAERNAEVYLSGRNNDKVNKLVETINMVLPKYALHTVCSFENPVDIDAIVSFVSAEKVVPDNFINYLKNCGIAIDGGIGNFSEIFILNSIKKRIKMRRLDVRLGLPFICATIEAEKHKFFKDVLGESIILGSKIVSGGIIGEEGSIIVDQIVTPSQMIGIANGIGGVKNESILTKDERDSIKSIEKFIVQSNQKNI